MKLLMRLLFAASICLLIACTAAAMPPSVNHTDNYTVVLTYGQTPYQIGYRASGNVTAWNWWDTGEGMQQQNLILAMVLNKTAHPVGGLSQPSFSLSQTRFRAGLNTYSWKADDDGTGNYSNNMDIWHWVPLDLTGHYNPELTFYTWYRIVPGDYGYVKVSTDGGNTWTELASYTGDQVGMPVKKTIDLNAYNNTDIILAFNFVSDAGGTNEGWYIDDIKVVVDGFVVPFFEWRLFGSTIFKDGATSAPPELVVDVFRNPDGAWTQTAHLNVYKDGKPYCAGATGFTRTTHFGDVHNPMINRGITRDVYAQFSGMRSHISTEAVIPISVKIIPGVSLLWAGCILMLIGIHCSIISIYLLVIKKRELLTRAIRGDVR